MKHKMAVVIVISMLNSPFITDKYIVFDDLIIREIKLKDDTETKDLLAKGFPAHRLIILDKSNNTVTKVNVDKNDITKEDFDKIKYNKWISNDASESSPSIIGSTTFNDLEAVTTMSQRTDTLFQDNNNLLNFYTVFADIPILKQNINAEHLRFLHFYNPDKSRTGFDFKVRSFIIDSEGEEASSYRIDKVSQEMSNYSYYISYINN